MNIFYTCSTENILKNFQFHKELLTFLRSKGNSVAYDWIESAHINLQKGAIGNTDLFYDRKLKAIKNADLVIVEISHKSFSLGHQITIAAQKAIPILLLQKSRSQINDFYKIVKSNWISYETYKNNAEAHEKVSSFIKSNKGQRKYRFNLVLNLSELAFIEEKTKSNYLTKTQYIKSLIHEKMENH